MLRSCPTCGLVQAAPEPTPGFRACCARCDSTLERPRDRSLRNSRTAALAAAALIIYPLAVSLPILEVRKLGVVRETGVLEGSARLLSDGHVVIGLVVFVCSVILPLFKLLSLLMLTSSRTFLRRRHRALTHRIVEWTGRYGMLDVLCVAILVAALKLGDLVSVRAGYGALAFVACVLLSLAASASFDPRSVWEDDS